MIVIRNTFHIRPEAMKQAIELAKQGKAIIERFGMKNARALVDVSAEFYTLVLESESTDLAEFERLMAKSFADSDWQAWYQQLTPLVQGGKRELFRTVD